MRTAIGAAAWCVCLAAAGSLPPQWSVKSGSWDVLVDVRPLLVQRQMEGQAEALNATIQGSTGAWRCGVQPSAGTERCGLRIAADADLAAGWMCEIGGNPGVGGFSLRRADGTILWQDRWAPWKPYDALVLECVVELGRIRAQLLEYDGETLISQSDWIQVPAPQTSSEGYAGVYAVSGVARFWDVQHAQDALVAVTENAPNKRRLVQSEESDWALFGTGNWMWTDSTRTRVRQYAETDRAWAVTTAVAGKDRVWQSHVRVSPKTGGAGMLFNVGGNARGGFNCWLGGTYGAGSLMLYQNAGPGGRGKALWSSPQDKWHYDEDLILRAETRNTRVRVELLEADGRTTRTKSPWIEMSAEDAAKVGFLGFHTWKGPAEFWAFSEETQQDITADREPVADGPGPDWRVHGPGAWELGAERTLQQSMAEADGACLNTTIVGSKGRWQCRLERPADTAEAGFLFQADPGLDEGFLCSLTDEGCRLYDLGQNRAVLWEKRLQVLRDQRAFIIQGLVQTDRVVVRLLSADGATVHAESPPIYVTDQNNTRRGCLGVTAKGGPVTFSDWQFTPED